MAAASSGRLAAVYVGSFLGPFGGAVMAVLIPQIAESLDASRASVAAGLTAYLVPFAALQLVSGTLGERWGRWRTVRTAYVAYVVASLLCAAAPSIETWLGARALQGAANAFTTPLLLAALADAVPAGRRGRAVGTFAAVQTAGVALSPLCGGLLGAIDWRLAFVVTALVAGVLALTPLPGAGTRRVGAPARFRAVLTRRVAILCAAGATGYLGVTSLAFLVALRAGDAFGLGPAARGVLVAGFGVAGMVCARPAGAVVDRAGAGVVAAGGALVGAVTILICGVAESTGVLALVWTLAGAGSAAMWTGAHTLTLAAAPGNTAGATSVVFAFRFGGNALAPIVLLPVYERSAAAAFTAAAGAAVVAAALLLVAGRWTPAR